MKRNILTIAIITLASFLIAQETNTTIGIKLYPGFSTVTDAGISEITPIFSFSGGIELKQRLVKDLIYLETGLYRFDRGYEISISTTDQNGQFIGVVPSTEHNYYLMIPLLAHFKLKQFYVAGGIHFNYYLSRKYFFDGELISEEKNSFLKEFPIGLQFNGGYEFPVNDKISVSTELFFNQVFKEKVINYGVGVGLKYALGND